MNNPQFQKIYKYSKVERLHSGLKNGSLLPEYFIEKFGVNEDDVLASTIKVRGTLALKTPKKEKDLIDADVENSILLYEHFGDLDETQASDPRLWTYLSHVEFRKYTLARWRIAEKYKDLKTEEERQKAINKISEHWFVGGNDRDLRRHSIARLWWAARLTHSPWDRDPEFFADLKQKDPYFYTRTLFFTQDIYQQVLERGMGRSNRILISLLDYFARNKQFAESREKIRALMKELNLIYGTKKIIALDRQRLKKIIQETAEGIDNTKK